MTTTHILNNEKQYKKLGFTNLEATEIILNLNELLANYQVHFHKLQNFHWNVKGRDFFELHEQFETMYNKAFKNVDLVAERIRVFGKTPVSSMNEYLGLADLKEAKTDLSGEYMVREILQDYETLLSCMIETIEQANKNGDAGTTDMINGFIKEMEKDHWQLSAWLSSKENE
ncbi:DNA starvation/stationary phase protection protein [Paracrocinitomix mangrovi]|uniref:Dps family protein n=1 Tax=Paracrocinitomix mangrovi TaxID=2862509 RepID=UPI001C8EBE9C|nr:DNA starvation/stationary phase protection protein [Paracrocinitomix mangrovi]UKN00272.1 DNA starvation/stationary phase protection protein [Paracrocinitomix mangrovi]